MTDASIDASIDRPACSSGEVVPLHDGPSESVADVQATPGRVASDAKKGLKSTVRGVRDAPGKLWSNVKGTFGGAPQEEEE